MGQVTRRGLLRAGAGIAAGTALAGGPLQGFVALADGRAAHPARPQRARAGARPARRHRPPAPARGVPVPLVPRHRGRRVTLDDGTVLPGRHDGMAAFRGRQRQRRARPQPRGQQPGAPRSGRGTPYDTMAGGGTTTIEVTRYGEVVNAFTSLNGTQMNCSGGPMPWGSWITCEETVNGPDVGPDFTGASNMPLTKPHGFLFEVPARRAVRPREPITAGRPLRPRGRRLRPGTRHRST